jgi:uncharacterized protein
LDLGDTRLFPGRDAWEDWINSNRFSCLGAKAAVRRKTMCTIRLGTITNADTTAGLHEAIERFVAGQLTPDENFATLIAIFEGPANLPERDFDGLLWQQLSDLHLIDVAKGFAWARDVSSDPESPRFSYSVAGHPFFIVGMHEKAARISRRSPQPAMAFNSHYQFQRLRESGAYAGLKRRIRQREELLQQSVNPNLAEFGEVSEARQYSGLYTGNDWRCPFRRHSSGTDQSAG